jgi:hypothetical protein
VRSSDGDGDGEIEIGIGIEIEIEIFRILNETCRTRFQGRVDIF